MSRSGYDIDGDGEDWMIYLHEANLNRSIKSAKGQVFMRDLLAALDALPGHRLIEGDLQAPAPAFIPPNEARPSVCAIGSLGLARGMDMSKLDPENPVQVAAAFKISPMLCREIVYQNDEALLWDFESPELRWKRMRRWVAERIID